MLLRDKQPVKKRKKSQWSNYLKSFIRLKNNHLLTTKVGLCHYLLRMQRAKQPVDKPGRQTEVFKKKIRVFIQCQHSEGLLRCCSIFKSSYNTRADGNRPNNRLIIDIELDHLLLITSEAEQFSDKSRGLTDQWHHLCKKKKRKEKPAFILNGN